jgi:Domain of unknown function (DUF389)
MTTLPGVAIAVAVMPPLCTVGFGIGSGLQLEIVRGAALLFLTNIVAIVFSAFVVFLISGLNSEELRAEVQKCRSKEPVAARLSHSPLMAVGGRLHWRILVLAAVVGAVSWPLQAGFRQLAAEAQARGAVKSEIQHLVPKKQFVSQSTTVARRGIQVRLVLTGTIEAAAVRKAEKKISAECNRAVQIIVQSVASQSELAQLMHSADRQTEQPAPADSQASGSVPYQRDEVYEQIGRALFQLWPPDSPVSSYSVQIDSGTTSVEVKYGGTNPLEPGVIRVVERALRQQLADDSLVLRAGHHEKPRLQSESRTTAGRTEQMVRARE